MSEVKSQTTNRLWGWNGDICAVWGVAIVLGETREEKERRARLIAAALEKGGNTDAASE